MNRRPIPDPRLEVLRNWTPFRVYQCDKTAPGRRYHDIVVVKATFTYDGGRLAVAAKQDNIVLADDYWDPERAETSSLRRAGEAILIKPRTDVLVTGTARAPGEKARPSWPVAVAVLDHAGETVLRHELSVTGPRKFRHHTDAGWVLTDPEPAAEVPVRYELAYGGAYRDPASPDGAWVVHWDNPSGTGFFDLAAMDIHADYPAPQWSLAGHPVTRINAEVPLAGLGPIARPWSARLPFAGTYDGAWEQKLREDVAAGLCSDYAADFDPRFFQCAHPALIAPRHLDGDEEILLTGLHPGEGPLTIQLPGVRVRARMMDGKEQLLEERLPLDTIEIDLDRSLVYLCWRLTLDQERDVRAAAISTLERI